MKYNHVLFFHILFFVDDCEIFSFLAQDFPAYKVGEKIFLSILGKDGTGDPDDEVEYVISDITHGVRQAVDEDGRVMTTASLEVGLKEVA